MLFAKHGPYSYQNIRTHFGTGIAVAAFLMTGFSWNFGFGFGSRFGFVYAGGVAMAQTSNSTSTQTQAQKQAKTFLRMAPLEKLTVGPYDNFQGVLTSDGTHLLLSQNINMATHVQVVDMTSVAARGHSKSLVSDTFDTRDPAASPSGKWVAYTSFERNARGQICVSPIEGNVRNCLPTAKNGARQPQWLSEDTVAYLEMAEDGETENLVSLDIQSKEKRTFFSDNILSFAFHPNGKFIVYSVAISKNGGVPSLRMRETGAKKGESQKIVFELPGLSGFPRFNSTGEFLYFSQFFNDTNSDGVIDGNDNAVPFRVSWGTVRSATTPIVPEQLISAEYNCGYPAASGLSLQATCNFEASLDIYRMPLAGVVPTHWTEEQILSAHAAARSLDERVLLLNTLRFRFPAKYDNAATVERLLSNHVVAFEFDAASYYAGVLAKKNASLAPTLQTLVALLDARNASLREKSKLPSPAFVSYVESLREKVRAQPVNEFSVLADVSFDWVLKKVDESGARWRSIDVSPFQSPMAIFIYGDLGKKILEEKAQTPEARMELERRLALHPALSEESQVSHALSYVNMLGQRDRDPKSRLQKLQTLSTGLLPDSVLDVFLKAELAAMELVVASDAKSERAGTLKLSDIFVKMKKRIFLKRGIYVRLLTQFTEFNKEQAVDMVASQWVSGTKLLDGEFVYAREQYLLMRLDKAYSYLNKNEIGYAGDVFYGAIRVTDDAEAHIGFMDARIRKGRGQELEKEYQDLAKSGFVAENFQLSQSWRDLQSSEIGVVKDSIKRLEQVIEADGYNPSVAWFLLGYAHHRVAIQSRHKLEFDRNAVESAHHAYSVALDLARGNKRLLAPLYSNLGHLHSLAHNYGQAASFYSERLKLPFSSEDDRVAVTWNAARLAYAGNNAQQALHLMEGVLPVLKQTRFVRFQKAYLEHAAFYALDASNWEKAALYYEQYFANEGATSERNDLKARLGLAWAFWKIGRSDEAIAAAQKVLRTWSAVKSDELNSSILVPFRSDRYAAQALAVLSDLETEAGKAVELRRARLNILQGWENNLNAYSLKKNDWRTYVLRERQHIAALKTKVGDPLAAVAWEECLADAIKYYDVKKETSDAALFYSILNTLVVIVDRNAPVSPSLQSKLDENVPNYLARLAEIANGSTVLSTRWLRVSLLWNAFRVSRGQMSVVQEKQNREVLFANALVKEILDTDPAVLESLPGRAKMVEVLESK